MKTLLKIVAGLVVLVLLVAACGYGYLMFAYPKVPPPTAFKIEATPERLARGKYLSDHVVGCTACHSKRDWTKFSGPVDPATLGAGGDEFSLGPAGVLYAKNITPAAIGTWTDGELLRAVTQGVSKDGTPLFPLMPYPHFGALDEEDIHAVLAYVRSFKAIENAPKPRQLNFPLNMIVRTIPAPNTFNKRPSPDDKLAYGKYMTKAALCTRVPHADRRAGHAVAGNGIRRRHGVPRNRLPRAGRRTSPLTPTPASVRGPSSSSSTSSRVSRSRPT